jgi:hypothetical protein
MRPPKLKKKICSPRSHNTFNIIIFKNRTLQQDSTESNTSNNLLIFYFNTKKDFLTLYFW